MTSDMFGTSEPDPMSDLTNLGDGFRDPSTYSGFPDPTACRADAHPEAWAKLVEAHRLCLFAALTHQSRRVADRELGGALAAAAQGAFDAAIGGIQEFWSTAALDYSMAYSHLLIPDTVPRVREVLAPLDRSEVALGLVETVYREALTAWLRGDPPAVWIF